MRIRGGGGGGSGGSGIISTGYVFNNANQDVLTGAQASVLLNQFTKKPGTTPDYSFLADIGNGGPGIQINTPGFYLVTVGVSVKTDTVGDVSLGADDPPYNCVMTNTFDEQYLSQINTPYTLKFTSMLFTTTGLPPDAVGVLITNHTLGTVTVLGFVASMAIMRLGDSPG